MMIEEFEKRTGYFPTAKEYAAIERAYMAGDADKDTFCAAYKKNTDGLAERIQREANIEQAKEDAEVAEAVKKLENGIPIGAINTIVDPVVYVDNVTNLTATAGGDDEEDDDSLRERIRIAPSRLSTAGPINAYKYWAMTADSSIADVCVKSERETLTRTLTVADGKIFKTRRRASAR